MTLEIERLYDKAYSLQGKGYEVMGTRVDEEYSMVTKSILLDWCKGVNSRFPFLDLGCGDGDLGNLLAYKNIQCSWVGMDISRVGLFNAKQENSKLLPVQGSGNELPFTSNSFGYVIAADSIEHMPNPDIAIGEIYRVLKSGGILAASIPAPNAIRSWTYNQLRTGRIFKLAPDLLRSVLLRKLYLGKTRFQEIDHELSYTEWIAKFEAIGFVVSEHREWPDKPFKPTTHLIKCVK